jgi:hypothetical protein
MVDCNCDTQMLALVVVIKIFINLIKNAFQRCLQID